MCSRALGSRLERRRHIDQAWSSYVRDDIAPDGLRDEIAQSWKRCRESYEIEPTLTHPRRVLLPDALEERRAHDDMLRLATPILCDFAEELSDHVLAYLDADGWLLSIAGDPSVVSRAAEIHFRPGANWTEESAGTNGPGTALAIRQPMEVFASEHFVEAFQSWSCAAAPLLVPGESAPMGLIDVTAPWDMQSRQALNLAKAIARAVEERFRAVISVREEVIRHALRATREAGDALLAVNSRGRVVATNDAAERRQAADARGLPPAIREALNRVFFSNARTPEGEVRLQDPDGATYVASAVRHDGSTVGAILRATINGAAGRSSRSAAHLSARYHFGRILGESEAIHQALELARIATRNDLPVVLQGESGTGKELFAHSIHAASSRGAGPFVVVNCGSIPGDLVEAELFGYEAGAYTGAKPGGSPGRFEDADGGTLFLDELSELPLRAQTALLRLLQEKEVVRIGASAPRRVDVRVVAATNKPLDEEVRGKRFRRDLYYRLNVLSIAVPPLRERDEDLYLLARVFLGEAQADVGRGSLCFTQDALDALRAHSWPGNVRELKNVILRAAATAPKQQITSQDLLFDADHLRPTACAGTAAGGTLQEAVLRSERSRLLEALDSCSWNFARAAHELGVSRMTLYRLVHKHGISRTPAPH